MIPRRAAFLMIVCGKIAFLDISFVDFPPCHQLKLWSLQSSAVTSEITECFLPRFPLNPRFWVVTKLHEALCITEESPSQSSIDFTQSPERAIWQMFSSSWKWRLQGHKTRNANNISIWINSVIIKSYIHKQNIKDCTHPKGMVIITYIEHKNTMATAECLNNLQGL